MFKVVAMFIVHLKWKSSPFPILKFIIKQLLNEVEHDIELANYQGQGLRYPLRCCIRAVEERGGGAGGLSPPSTISRGAEHPLYFLQTIYSSVKGSISKIKSPENMLIY